MNQPLPNAKSRLDGTKALSRLAANLCFEDMTGEEVRAAKRHLLDTLGAIIAGSDSEPVRIAEAMMADLEGPGDVPVPGRTRRWNRLTAAYLSGASAHGLELDDGYRPGSVHPGAPVVAALLAGAWDRSIDGRELIAALCVGYELVTRVAEAAHPGSRNRGFHNTSISGVFGAAASIGRLRRFDPARMEQALGIAASSAAGLFAFLRGGGEIKRLHPGMAAREGLYAALLAERGMTGPRDVMEIQDGFLQAYSDNARAEVLKAGLDDGRPAAFNVTRCYLKPYACCRHIHPAIDAVKDIVSSERIDPAGIAAIRVGTYAIAAEHAHATVTDMASAQLNYQYCTAVGALRGNVGVNDFDAASLKDAAIAALMKKITVSVDEECQGEYPRLRAAKVALEMADGRIFERYVDEPSGSVRHPLDDKAVWKKFAGLAMPVIGTAAAERVRDLVETLDKQSSVDLLILSLVRPDKPRAGTSAATAAIRV